MKHAPKQTMTVAFIMVVIMVVAAALTKKDQSLMVDPSLINNAPMIMQPFFFPYSTSNIS